MPFIYKIENQINHKVYIGKTLYTIERRWKQHKTNIKWNHIYHMPLYSAMNKYGVDNFSISCVEEVQNENELSEREQYWIRFYDSYNQGYNATLGGDGSLLYDYDTIWELWESGKTIKQISKEVGCNDFVVRTVLDIHNISTEERKERSIDDQLLSHEKYKRKVNQIDISSNEVINTYESVREAARKIGADNSTMSKICAKSETFKGYKWEYTGNEYTKKDFSSRRVCQLDLKTNKVINIFPSISEAARSVSGDSSYLSKVCRGIYKSSKGYGWKYYDK